MSHTGIKVFVIPVLRVHSSYGSFTLPVVQVLRNITPSRQIPMDSNKSADVTFDPKDRRSQGVFKGTGR